MEETATKAIELTPKAIQRVRLVMQQKPEIGGLRLGVQGGGCSGFSYVTQFESGPRPTDYIFDFEGARVFVDPKSMVYLRGMTLDYKSDLMQQGFVIHNPNAKTTCGCGSSFSA
ncbi:MAG TPA: iron-sulfur cluster assembly accessory protein [Terriglobia bacterium]|nr:iron-sulfur cluster assembly accessory protein [Terriglobia bacterium]